ncbi:MAG: type transport system ATP-binding protein [Clostridia bacterium]|jgi:hypothetical protein|nr:type transport system ATP-binding protein [Clostridia bacterium]
MLKVKIHIKGLLDTCWIDWFNGLEMYHTETGETILEGVVADTGAFYGIIAKINNLGLELLKAYVFEPDG